MIEEQTVAEEPQRDYRGKLRSFYQTVNNDPSETIQSDAKRADIKEIMREHGVTNIIEHLAETDAQFMDVTQFTDYADVFREAKKAEFEFMKLPPEVRSLFNHDVARWLDAAHDQDKAEAIEDKIDEKVAKAAPAPVEPLEGETPPV